MLYTKDEMEAGTKIIQEFFKAFVGEERDDRMDIDDDDDGEMDLQQLRSCFDKFRPQLEANPWCKSVLAELGA